MKTRIAVIDDESIVCRRLKTFLDGEGYETESFDRGAPFLERMADAPFDVVFLDLGLPDADGMDILRRLIGHYEDLEVVIITGQGTIDSAVEAIKFGAYHYVTKPFRLSEIGSLAGGAAKKLALKKENRRLRETLGGDGILPEFCGSSRSMQEIISMVKKVALVDCNVLLQGESGTGKELVARSIHRLSPRGDRPFVSFNSGGFTEELICNELFGHEKGAFTGATATKIGLLESGSGGTVFLDEIGEMPLSMQVRLLRVLQEKQILRVGGTKPIPLDIRIVAASNKDIKRACTEGGFREDLYYRLNVVSLQLPCLAERKEDIPLLITSFMAKYNGLFGKTVRKVSPQVMDILMRYNFPGNVRELENIIQRAVALAEGEDIRVTDLPEDLQNLEFDTIEGEGLMTIEEMEKLHIMRVLDRTRNNKALTSKILNLPRTTLWRKMKKYGLLEDESGYP
ncbi:MAG: sigma-54 dependent transcriptional regulator [Desulfobacterales bacterium]|jgi:DNA-binding NtrC family response regulator